MLRASAILTWALRAAGVALGLAGSLGAQEPSAEEAEALAALQQLFKDRTRNPEALQKMASLLNGSVVSASNRLEQLWGAPANLQVFTRAELEGRGYRSVWDLLEDLPGMDLARTYGDVAFTKVYWRGFRNTYGDPFLVLVDGQVFNHLWYHNTEVPLLAFPLSAVERVEVVSGPSSALYGPNALMGVIHILTVRNQGEEGSRLNGSTRAGSLATRGADLSFFLKREDFRLRISAKAESSELDERGTESYEYARRSYREDPRIWARAFLDSPTYGPAAPSPIRTKALDVRAMLGGTEAAFSFLWVETGMGLTYAGDQSQRAGSWMRPEYSFHLKHDQTLTDTLASTTTFRWRKDGLDPRSWDLEAKFDPALGTFVNRFSYWHQEQSAWSLSQDFDWWLGWRWSLNFGFRLEEQDLQRDYDRNREYYPIAAAVIPPPLPDHTAPGNRVDLRPWGAYAQGRMRLDEQNLFHLGVRHDWHPTYGATTNVRMAYAGRFGAWSLKALYGEGFQEPSPRTLYGGFGPAGSNPDLRPETSRTAELLLAYTTGLAHQSASLYQVRNRDTVTYVQNLGTREIWGLDLQTQVHLPVPGLDEVRGWAFYSRTLRARGEPAGDLGLTASGAVGDLSKDRVGFGLSGRRGAWSGTLRGRYVGPRETVASNPLGRVGGYGTADLALRWTPGPLALQVSISNLLDRRYDHPGVFQADAGNVPGRFATDAQGVLHWYGSGGLPDSQRGYYASLLPQPGRTFTISLLFRP